MQAGVWIRYIFGEGRAIREVAESRGALWTGMGLVLLTAVARSYDQTYIGQNPLLWLFGPLLFSLVSGTWLFAIVYVSWVRRRMDVPQAGVSGPWRRWREFMGLFWMTAPVAWIYAIPVERFMDPVAATHANIALLIIVSLWRVLLMTRVIQCLTTSPFSHALSRVLFAATLQVLLVYIFGGGCAKAAMKGMGGMRNSPAEAVMLHALDVAVTLSFLIAPIAWALSRLLRHNQPLQPLPAAKASRFPMVSLSLATAFWVCVSIVPQIQLSRNYTVEELLRADRPREGLDFLSRHQPGQFAPARALPPKPFEYSVFRELPACMNAIQPSDSAWVRELLVLRLNETMIHYRPRWGRFFPSSKEEHVEQVRHGVQQYHHEPDGLLHLVNGLARIPEGQAWLATNEVFLLALKDIAGEAAARTNTYSLQQDLQRATWRSLSNRIQDLLPTVSVTPATNYDRAPSRATP